MTLILFRNSFFPFFYLFVIFRTGGCSSLLFSFPSLFLTRASCVVGSTSCCVGLTPQLPPRRNHPWGPFIERALLSCLVTRALFSPFHKIYRSWNLLWAKCAASPTTSYLHIWSPTGGAVLGGCRTFKERNMAGKWLPEGGPLRVIVQPACSEAIYLLTYQCVSGLCHIPLLLWPPCLPCYVGLISLKLWAEINPSSLRLFLPGSITAERMFPSRKSDPLPVCLSLAPWR